MVECKLKNVIFTWKNVNRNFLRFFPGWVVGVGWKVTGKLPGPVLNPSPPLHLTHPTTTTPAYLFHSKLKTRFFSQFYSDSSSSPIHPSPSQLQTPFFIILALRLSSRTLLA